MRAAWAWGGLAAVLWVPLGVSLSEWWRSDPAHMHGWLAPLFMVWLAAGRWADRPEETAPSRGVRAVATAMAAGWLAVWAGALVVLVPNPLWPTAQWAGCAAASGVWLALAWREGGAGWARHFGWVAWFPLGAAAWPTVVTEAVFAGLSPWIAAVATEIVNVGGRLAVAQGAVIEVTGGWVGVDEACSGLRSLESAVLMAWFLGEQRRLSGRARFGLAAGAMGIAVAGNVLRATWLVWIAADGAPVIPTAWHDGTGLAAMVLTLAAILGWAEFFKEGACNRKMDTRGAAGWWRVTGTAAAALVLAAAGRGWYAQGPADGAEPTSWRVASRVEGWREAPEPPGAKSSLQVSRLEGLAGEGPGWQALTYVLAWEDDVTKQEITFIHGPEICLPAIGAVLDAELGEQRVSLGGREVPWTLSRYVTPGGLSQHVWLVRWDGWRDGAAKAERGAHTPTQIRLDAVRMRRARAAMTLAVVVAAGFANDEAAKAWFAEWGPRVLMQR